ncbi:hypothetical protein BS47DRAFT_125417 [Hydnum rufescens UP504]|uniref:Uncharacterized protein n=1 Tax=Hydnum rufescens UP504 TaxID=1448309 RepID=A0A9P6B7Z8_9AGAM|nr:hypothetical protein BS47DRAFT_125417 [Hydnum rufescens UP504]
MHIFLGRPSSPYARILVFLRSIAASARPTLPHGLLQMPASSAARMEAVFELRDEARHLGMAVLEKLGEAEISRGYAECSGRRGTTALSVGMSGYRPQRRITHLPVPLSCQTLRNVLFPRRLVLFPRWELLGWRRSRGDYIYMGRRLPKVSTLALLVPPAAWAVALSNIFLGMSSRPSKRHPRGIWIPVSNMNAGVGISGTLPRRLLGLTSRQKAI